MKLYSGSWFHQKESMHLTFFTIQKLLNRGVFKFPLDYSLALRTTGGLHSEYHALLQGRAAVDGFPFSCPKQRGMGALAAMCSVAAAAATRAHSEAEQAAFECKLASVVFISSAAAELCASLRRHSGQFCIFLSKFYEFSCLLSQ